MELEDVLPSKPEFTLSKNNKTYTLRLVDFNDHIWIKEKFGSKAALEKAMSNLEWEKIILLVYRLLDDKTDFTASREKIHNDDGEIIEVLMTGPYKLLREMTSLEDSMNVLNALSASIIKSNPMIKDYVLHNAKEEIKKIKKKLTGQKSLT